MKYILFLLLFLPYSSIGQIVPSSCTAPDSIVAKYKTDAQKLALSRIYSISSSYKDSATIPVQWSDSIMRGLLAIYNCSLPERDTVIKQHYIHVRSGWDMFELNDIIMYVDTSKQWVKDILINKTPNSNLTVDGLLKKYHFTNSNLTGTRLTLYSDSNYNMNVVAMEWAGINGLLNTPSAHNLSVGDGSYIIADSLTDSFIILTYSYGWGDCPSGCTCRRFWQYKVYQNCDVELIKTWEVVGPSCYLAIHRTNLKKVILNPNPFTDFISMDINNRKGDYKIIFVDGRQILSGNINSTTQIDTRGLVKGVYTLILSTEDKVETFKIIKE